MKKISIHDVADSFSLYQPASIAYPGDIYLKNIDSKFGKGFHEECSLWRASYMMQSTKVHSVGCYKLSEIDLYINRNCCAWKKDDVVSGPEIVPEYVFGTDDFKSIKFDREPDVFISEPAIVVAGWGIGWYGHFIADFVPRLLSMYFHDKHLIEDLPIYLPFCASAYVADLIGILFDGLSVDVRFLPADSVTRFKEAYIPTYFSNDVFYHPSLNFYIDNLVMKHGANGFSSDKIYITRKHRNFIQMSDRFLDNESGVEEILLRRGYKIIAAEELSFQQKFLTLSQCKIILGSWGSGLHNSLFARYGTIVGCLGVGTNMLQSGIGALRCQPTSYLQLSNPSGKQYLDFDVFNHWVDSIELSL